MRLIIFTLLLLAAPAWAQNKPTAPEPDSGRYRISNSDTGTLLLDSTTGKTWRLSWIEVEAAACKGKGSERPDCRRWGWLALSSF